MGLPPVLAATLLTLAAGYLLKLPCVTGPWDGRQYTGLCYSDVMALAGSDGHVTAAEADKYPVGARYLMDLVAVPASSLASFFNWTAALWSVLALVTTWALWAMTGSGALFFAAAPTLAIYGFMNWDLPLVTLATLGTLAYLRGRNAAAGLFLGVGGAIKIPYPGILVVPFGAGRVAERRPDDARRILVAAAGAWVVLNFPVAVATPDRWLEAFRFNAARPADWDTVWFFLGRHLGFEWPPAVINGIAGVTFVAAFAAVWWVASRRRPGFPAWTLGLPLIACYFLTGKVFSPQWTTWLLPWFALTLPDLRLFVAFEVADVLVFVTRFLWFAELEGYGGLSIGVFEAALIARAAVLVLCVVAWIRRDPPPVAVGPGRRRSRLPLRRPEPA